MSHTLHLPIIHNADNKPSAVSDGPCNMVEQAAGFAVLWRTHILQQRRNVVCDDRLVKPAQWLAEDIRASYAGEPREVNLHIDSLGRTPNERVRAYGYDLPYWYPVQGNQVESIAIDYGGPAGALESLLGSPGHYPHVSGSDAFYREQVVFGVGHAAPGYWVLVTAPADV